MSKYPRKWNFIFYCFSHRRNILHIFIISRLIDESRGNYETRKAEVAQFNVDNAFRKRGLAILPMTWFHDMGLPIKYVVHVSEKSNSSCPICKTK